MEEICNSCGLPKNLCVCVEIAKESEKIKIRTMSKRFGKIVTIVSGIRDKEGIKELVKVLKHKLACGGTIKGDEIELQGNHRKRIKEILLKEGYKEEQING